MHIKENYSLKSLNTFGVEAFARYYIPFFSEEELIAIFKSGFLEDKKYYVLGGGSNILFTQNFEGVILHNQIFGKEVAKFSPHERLLIAKSGENWHNTVLYSIDSHLYGIENLSLIPGSVGASPVQNIGAYGVEVKDTIYKVRAFDTQDHALVEFKNADCRFNYRDSIFKKEQKGRYIITEVSYLLSTEPNFHLSYGAILEELNLRSIKKPTLKEVSDVICHIRIEKLPDPSTVGNSGSFFKNPIISKDHAEGLIQKFPNIVCYPAREEVKIAAGWLIEQCGFKGYLYGNTGTWKHQALVLINQGNATGTEVFKFSNLIISAVENKFGIVLEREVNIL